MTGSDNDVVDLREIDATQIPVVGGKGAHLGELFRIAGVRVPAGFCVTTGVFRRIVAELPSIGDRLDQLSRVNADDRGAVRSLSAEIRNALEAVEIPAEAGAAVTRALGRLGERTPCAVRSSATAEDLPVASFAGQHDSYLAVVGPAAVLAHVRRCWASLFTERAVTYRLRNGIDHRGVVIAVVVQHLVAADAAGVLFTADPVSGNRRCSSVEATFGLGEALVSGLVNPDVYRLRDGRLVAKQIATKPVAVVPSPAGGTVRASVDPARRDQPALTDEQVARLAELGRRIEAHFGHPQDIEWCLAGDDLQIVQSRPITTLFPIPAAADGGNRVYVSVGHQQMMTDPMKPLGLSVWMLTSPAPMREAGGRLFVDVTEALASPATRPGLVQALGRSDPLIGDALQTIVDRGDFLPSLPADGPAGPPPGGPPAPIETDPSLVTRLIEQWWASTAEAQRTIGTTSGPALFDLILSDLQELKRMLFDPLSHQVIMAGMEATWWLNDQLETWLGERNAADVLAQSVSHNVTAEMGLALLDVADAIRPHREVVALLEEVEDDDFLDTLDPLEGGPAARHAIEAWLGRYGMRCVGEIDITRPRWSEHPAALVPLLLANVKNFEPGEGERRFERGRQQAQRQEQEVLRRLRALPGGDRKAAETKEMIDRLRAYAGYREHPKYGMISRYFVYKQALLGEAERLVAAGALNEKEDIYFLTFGELHDLARTQRLDGAIIARRRADFAVHHALTAPRVLTSEGEMVAGSYRRAGLPRGALVGLPVSAGTVEGRARVVLDIADADLEPGDILVTAYTDPSWTPAFVAVSALVAEVGGLMTHGAVIAREYGLPAVVGVEHATQLIRDGQQIRVDGTEGYVEILQ